jgi:hypothetical protein
VVSIFLSRIKDPIVVSPTIHLDVSNQPGFSQILACFGMFSAFSGGGGAVKNPIVVIRTFLSFAFQVELEGHWPWQEKMGEA